MAPVIFVEVLDRRGRVRHRERLDSFPATIGRAYSNDVILEDRFVSPEHVIVTQTDAGLRLEDQDSHNGVFLDRQGRRVSSLTLGPGAEVRIGHTRLRFCTPEQPVAPTARHVGSGIASLFASTGVKVVAIAVVVLALISSDYLETYQKVEMSDILTVLAVALSLLLVWAGLWALGNRLVSHEFRFMAHWTVASVAALVLTAAGTVFEYLDFFFSEGTLLVVLGWSAYGLVSAGLIYTHLSVASTMVPARRAIASVLTVTVLYGLLGIVEFAQRDDFSHTPEFASELKPVGAAWLATRPPGEFFAATAGLEEKLDRLAKEENAEEPADR